MLSLNSFYILTNTESRTRPIVELYHRKKFSNLQHAEVDVDLLLFSYFAAAGRRCERFPLPYNCCKKTVNDMLLLELIAHVQLTIGGNVMILHELSHELLCVSESRSVHPRTGCRRGCALPSRTFFVYPARSRTAVCPSDRCLFRYCRLYPWVWDPP